MWQYKPPVFIERFGIDSAAEIGIACSTFGLILGGLAGGPLARRLIARHRLQSTDEQHLVVGKRYDQSESIDVDTLLQCVFWIFVAVGLGGYLQKVTGHLGLFMPDFVSQQRVIDAPSVAMEKAGEKREGEKHFGGENNQKSTVPYCYYRKG